MEYKGFLPDEEPLHSHLNKVRPDIACNPVFLCWVSYENYKVIYTSDQIVPKGTARFFDSFKLGDEDMRHVNINMIPGSRSLTAEKHKR